MTLPSSGPITMAQINGEFGRGYSLSQYLGTSYFVGTNQGTFPGGPISFSNFYGTQVSSSDPYTLTSSNTVTINPIGSGGGIFFGRNFIIAPSTTNGLITYYMDGQRHHTNLQISIDGVIGRTQLSWNGNQWVSGWNGYLDGVYTVTLWATDNY